MIYYYINKGRDPDPDPTCNNGFINYFYFHLEQNINQN